MSRLLEAPQRPVDRRVADAVEACALEGREDLVAVGLPPRDHRQHRQLEHAFEELSLIHTILRCRVAWFVEYYKSPTPWREAMHSSAQPFAARTICSARTSGSTPACSRGTSTTTWWTAASTAPPNSCRCSETIAKDGRRPRSSRASSSISAGVAYLPAKTPKLTRTSTPGSSCSRTSSEMAGSSIRGLMRDSLSGRANP